MNVTVGPTRVFGKTFELSPTWLGLTESIASCFVMSDGRQEESPFAVSVGYSICSGFRLELGEDNETRY